MRAAYQQCSLYLMLTVAVISYLAKLATQLHRSFGFSCHLLVSLVSRAAIGSDWELRDQGSVSVNIACTGARNGDKCCVSILISFIDL